MISLDGRSAKLPWNISTECICEHLFIDGLGLEKIYSLMAGRWDILSD